MEVSNEEKRLIWFYGKECPHCRALRPMVEKYQQDSNIKIEHLEVWHNEENAKLMRSHADKISEACGGELGVPAFYNEKTGKAICGAKIPLEKLKKWAEE
jgi:thiol-disulfide isomerase/thioredoxin